MSLSNYLIVLSRLLFVSAVSSFLTTGYVEAKSQESPLRDSYIQLSPSVRYNIQHFLAVEGFYGGDIDGLWGPATESAAKEAYLLYPSEFARFEIDTEGGAKAFLESIAILFHEKYPEGGYEGGSLPDEYLGDSAVESGREISSVCDGFASLLGLCWRLSDNEMIELIRGRGYNCRAVPANSNSFFVGLSGGRLLVPENLCSNPRSNAAILLYSDRLAFNCINFNVCQYGVREIAQLVMEWGQIYEMENFSEINGNGDIVERYCGRTPDLQRICVGTETIYTMQTMTLVSLERGGLGSPSVSFD